MTPKHAALPARDAGPDPFTRPKRPEARLNEPVRALVATGELVLAVALGFAVVWAWRRGSIPYELPVSDNPAVPDTVQRWSGPWIGAAFALAAVAGLLVLDAVRQLMLAVAGGWHTAERGRDGADEDEDTVEINRAEINRAAAEPVE